MLYFHRVSKPSIKITVVPWGVAGWERSEWEWDNFEELKSLVTKNGNIKFVESHICCVKSFQFSVTVNGQMTVSHYSILYVWICLISGKVVNRKRHDLISCHVQGRCPS